VPEKGPGSTWLDEATENAFWSLKTIHRNGKAVYPFGGLAGCLLPVFPFLQLLKTGLG